MSAVSCWNGSTGPVCWAVEPLCELAEATDGALDEPPQAVSMVAGDRVAWAQMLDAILPMDAMPGS